MDGRFIAKKIRAGSNGQVFIRPLPDLHSVAEITSHLTFWRNEALIKIKIGAGTKTDDCEENWLPNRVLEEKGWKTILNEYDQSL